MINLIKDLKVMSQGQDYAILGDGAPILTGLTQEEANSSHEQLKTGHVVGNTVYRDAKNIDLEYWKEISKYPYKTKHTLVPVKFVVDVDGIERMIFADDNDWVFMSIGATLITVVTLGRKRAANMSLKDFGAAMNKHGIALGCKLY